jgi:AraC-like DNA-binding protein
VTASTYETRRFFAADSALFLGLLPPPSPQSHHAIQGCVALDGQLEIRSRGRVNASVAAALVGPDVHHAVSASGLVAHFYALPESPAGSRLVEALSGRPVVALGLEGLAEVRQLLLESLTEEARLPQCLERLLELALRGAPPARRRDARAMAVLDALRFRSRDTSLALLAREVGLSPDRLRHLIREEAGIPLRRYRRWARLLRAIEALRDTGSVTAAASTAGFADAAHLSRTFRAAFTFPPSAFLRNSRFVQARDDGSA